MAKAKKRAKKKVTRKKTTRKKIRKVSRMSKPEVIKAVGKGKKKIISRTGFTKPAIDYGKRKKGIKLMCRGKKVA